MTERRYFKRHKLNFIVYFKVDRPLDIKMLIGDKQKSANMVDISEIGMAIFSIDKIPAGTTLSITFTIMDMYAKKQEDRIKTIKVLGNIQNVAAVGKGYRLGILFKYMGEKDKDLLKNFIELASRK
ncbi:MAG: PilZ domain-containing protein [Candidatus Omnitrophota bacterium]